jgi:hypothetical protein
VLIELGSYGMYLKGRPRQGGTGMEDGDYPQPWAERECGRPRCASLCIPVRVWCERYAG